MLNMSMGIGSATGENEFGIPGTLSNIYGEEAARRFYGRWLELLQDDGDAPSPNGAGEER
jgi:hypothetical protein